MKSLLAVALLILVQDGKPVATIVTPDKPTHWETVAAEWLQTYVQESTGAKLPIVAESKAPKGALISVGHTAMAKRAGIRTDDLKYDGCKMVVKDNVLYLIGRDVPGLTPKSTGYDAGARGTCRAVTKFLEDIVGVRWYLPTPEGEKVPRKAIIGVRSDLNVSFSPAFGFAHGRYIYGTGPASIANNFRTAILIRSYGGHSYYPWVPEKEYGKDHPEYFMMTDGGKRDPGGNHLCTSNPQVRELLKKGLFEKFDDGFEWVACGQTDGYQRCQCPKCEAMDEYGDWVVRGWTTGSDASWEAKLKLMCEHPCERLHLTHKWLIDEARKKYPNKKIHLLVYGPTVTPSKKFDYYGDNVVLEICSNADPRIIELWKGRASAFTVYVCWFDITVGYGYDIGFTPAETSSRIRHLHENGCVGIYFGGGGANWGYMGPTYYVLARMLGDPGLDYEKLVKEYCDAIYGNASQNMQDFFDLLYARVCMEQVPGASMRDMQIARYPSRFLLSLDELLANAELKADTERSRNFIRMTRDHFDFNKLITKALLAYRTWKVFPTDENWTQIKEAVEAFDEFRGRVVRYDDAFTAKYFPGHGKFCNYLSSRASGAVYYSGWQGRRKEVLSKPLKGTVVGYSGNAVSIPLTLNFDKPPKLGEMDVHRVTTPLKLDGKLDDPAWAKSQVQVVPPMLVSQKSVPTKVRLLYDDRNIYVGFECDEPLIDKLVARTTGRDGRIWTLDCGEILFGPDRVRRRYYHYIIAPAKDALYDDRTGFKTLEDQDASWNGPCEYAYFVDKPNKRWFLEVRIPFSTLETEAPKPGTWWLANFGRERYAHATGFHKRPGLFLWSQEESLGFCDPAAFGKIRFTGK